jgi:uncharacterized protein (TIGR02265 family)
MTERPQEIAAPPEPRRVAITAGAPAVVRPGDILCQPIDVEAQREGVPAAATTKGLFVNLLGAYVKQHRPEAADEYRRFYPRAYSAFQDVPLKDTLWRGADAARLAHPELPLAEALRRMGRPAWQNVLSSLLGRVLFATLGRDLSLIFRYGPRGFEVFEKNSTRVRYEQLGDRHFRYRYDPCYNFIDCYHVGVIEGVVLAFGLSPEITVALEARYSGAIECRW